MKKSTDVKKNTVPAAASVLALAGIAAAVICFMRRRKKD